MLNAAPSGILPTISFDALLTSLQAGAVTWLKLIGKFSWGAV